MIASGGDHARMPMADLLRGTVTFLFTDIEGSTALWERDPAAMQAAMARHDTVLSDAIAAHQGALYKHVGDTTGPVMAPLLPPCTRHWTTGRSPRRGRTGARCRLSRLSLRHRSSQMN